MTSKEQIEAIARAIGRTDAKNGGPIGAHLWDVDLKNAAQAAFAVMSEEMRVAFDRQGFEQRAAAHLKNDLDQNGRITPDGIAMIGAEAELYAARAALSSK